MIKHLIKVLIELIDKEMYDNQRMTNISNFISKTWFDITFHQEYNDLDTYSILFHSSTTFESHTSSTLALDAPDPSSTWIVIGTVFTERNTFKILIFHQEISWDILRFLWCCKDSESSQLLLILWLWKKMIVLIQSIDLSKI